ncbi:hypothetical protein BGZ95_011498, partial [Linnemannia exigua]
IVYHDAIPVIAPAFARSVNKLYVLSGVQRIGSAEFLTPQFMSLDLTVPWNSTKPAWMRLEDGPQQNTFPAAFSSDEQTLFAFHIQGTNAPLQYSVQDNKWQVVNIKFENAGFDGIGAVTDPRTGLIYLAGGYVEGNYNAPFYKFLDIFDPVTLSIHTVDLPNPAIALPVRRYYGNVWSKHRNSILYWGGSSPSPDSGVERNSISEFSTDKMTWSTMCDYEFGDDDNIDAATRGVSPSLRSNHCMATNEDGTKVVIYGGINPNKTVMGELWVLDPTSSTWSQGRSGPSRHLATCTIAGDYFLLWGGVEPQETIATSEMIIYDFKTSTYVKQYTPPEFYKDLKSPLPLTRTKAPWDTNNSTTNNKINTGAAVGGAIGGLVLMGAIVGFFFFFRKFRQGQLEEKGGFKNKGKSGLQGAEGFVRRSRGGELGEDLSNSRETNVDENLARTLREIEDEQVEIDNQLQSLKQKQGLNRGSQRREPMAILDDTAGFPLPPPPRLSPDATHLMSYSAERLINNRTVQATSSADLYHGDGGSKRECEMAQDEIEPIYGPSPKVNIAVPDLVYVPPPNIGMNWTKQQLNNHPHT